MSSPEHPQKMPVMAHLVLGYPTLAESLRTAGTYISAGVQVLELQIPFSHPTADGPIITAACREAVRQGVTVRDCIAAIADVRRLYPEQEIVAMSYLNRIYSFGFQRFTEELTALGIRHLIVPDLPVDENRWAGRNPADERQTVKLVPVLAANISDTRLEKLLQTDFDFFYLMSDFKITGSTFSLNPRLNEIIGKIKTSRASPLNQPPKTGIGFGISTAEQARTVVEVADLAIIGSALIQAQRGGRLEQYLAELKNVFPTATGVG